MARPASHTASIRGCPKGHPFRACLGTDLETLASLRRWRSVGGPGGIDGGDPRRYTARSRTEAQGSPVASSPPSAVILGPGRQPGSSECQRA